jgi:arginyl-tRNA synthetase
MTALTAELTAIVSAAFAAEGLPAELGLVQVSNRPDLAQFQCSGALPAAKQARLNPRAVAEKIAARLKANPLFAKVEIAGPGFINLDLARRKPAPAKPPSSISAAPMSPSRCMWGTCARR